MAGTAATLQVAIVANIGQFMSQMAVVKGTAATTGSALNTAIGAGALAAAAGFFKSANAAADWEDAMAGVMRTVDVTGKTTEEAADTQAKLDKGLRGLARTIPIAHDELASMAETAGALGVPADAIPEFARIASILGILSDDLTASSAAFHMGKIRTIFGMETSELDNFGSAVVKLGMSGASTEGEILSMSERAAGAIAAAGGGTKDMLAFSAAFANVAEEADAGGSGISRMFQNATDAISQGGPRLQNFANAAGLTVDAFREMFKADPGKAIQMVVNGLADLDEASTFRGLRSLGINQVRWTRGWSKVISAVRNGATSQGDLNDSMAEGAKGMEDGNFIAEIAETRFDTFNKTVDQLRNDLYDLGITVGNALLPIFRQVVDFIIPIVNGFNDLLQQFPEVTAAVVPLLTALSALAAIRFGWRMFSMIFPTGPLGAALGQSVSQIIDKGLMGPVGKAMGKVKMTIANGIKNALLGGTAQQAAAQAGSSIGGQLLAGVKDRLSSKGGIGKMLGGGALFGLGTAAQAGAFGKHGGMEKIAGGMAQIVGMAMMFGPGGAIAGAILAIGQAFMDFQTTIHEAQQGLKESTKGAIENMDIRELEEAIAGAKRAKAELEAGGNITLAASKATRGTIFSGLFGDADETVDKSIADLEGELNRRRGELHDAGARAGGAAGDGVGDGFDEEMQQVRVTAMENIKSWKTELETAATFQIKVKPPKLQGFKSRMKQLKGSMSQAWKNLQRAVKANDPVAVSYWTQRLGEVQGSIDTMKQNATTDFVTLADNLEQSGVDIGGTFLQTKADAQLLKENLATKTNSAEGAAVGNMEGIVTKIDALSLTSSGQHFVDTLVVGMGSRLNNVLSMSSRIAAAARLHLGFSSPPPGPLNDIRQWGPHMIDQWTGGILGTVPRVRTASMAIAAAFSPNPKMNWHGGAMGGVRGRREKETHIHVGTLIANDRGIDELDRRMNNRKRIKKRRRRSVDSPNGMER